MVTPVDKRRGWVAVPTFDMRQYVQAQLLTAAAGFMVGMGMGAIFGNFMSGKSITGPISAVARNPPKKRTSRKPTRKMAGPRKSPPQKAPKRRTSRKRGRDPEATLAGLEIREETARLRKTIGADPAVLAKWKRLRAEETATFIKVFKAVREGKPVAALKKKHKSLHARIRKIETSTGYIDWDEIDRQRLAVRKMRAAQMKKYRALEKRLVKKNPKRRTSRRTSVRKRKRGRPTAGAVHEVITLRMDGEVFDISVEKGRVFLRNRAVGTIYDLGTSFRSIPYRDGEVRSFGTLAGAVKHVIREWEKAA